MAVVILSTTEIHEVQEKHDSDYLVLKLLDNDVYKAMVIKCTTRDGAFYRDMMREHTGSVGRMARFIDYLTRRGTEVIYVEKEENGDRRVVYATQHEHRRVPNDVAIIRVDDSIDPVLMQRAMDKDRWVRGQIGQPYEIASSIDHLISNGLINNQHRVTMIQGV